MKAKQYIRLLIGTIFITLLPMFVVSVLMYAAESEAQPEVFANALSGLRWGISFFSGYGGIYPVTVFGKVLAMIFVGLRILFLSTIIGITVTGLTLQSRKNKIGADKNAHLCPHCGKNVNE